MILRECIAYWIFPPLRAEIAALRSGNTKVVLENQKLFDALREALAPTEGEQQCEDLSE